MRKINQIEICLFEFFEKNDLKKKNIFTQMSVESSLEDNQIGSNWLIEKKTSPHIHTQLLQTRRSFDKMAMQKRANLRLPPEINRVLYVRNLPYKITAEEMYDIFGKYGAIRQIRVGNTPDTRGKRSDFLKI